MNSLRAIGKVYKRHPLVGNMLLYVGLYGAGDISRQIILREKTQDSKLDFKSAARMSTVGSLLIAPFNYNFYRILDKVVLGSGARIVFTKIVCDQVFSTPIAICIFYIGIAIVERRKDLFSELKEKGLQTYATGAVYWSCVQTFNFALLPTHLRAPYVGFCAFFWCNILSYFKSRRSQRRDTT
ncbi:hypothetical protein CAPTEDRAFT_178253 [Capitella teleta]|uniref:Mpv17-like protein n=1 Tax=Capitella teleta TaxID=283909 RepID=R7UPB4_CAPTE|nr:hypothetical protein CAPTEDRAFT_178253 [Capitella teleta]|eukprot:ELU05241.1 hypothetical protein CAPTEDRAFT_178253 [Capitella teleta]